MADVDVANGALSLLGERLLVNLSGTDDVTASVNIHLPAAKGAVLRDVAPRVAIRYFLASPVSGAGVPRIPEFGSVFELPPDCKRLFAVKYGAAGIGGLQPVDEWKVVGRYVGATAELVELVYVSDLPTDEWDESSLEALHAKLAMLLSYSLTESRAKRQDMAALYQEFRDEAKRIAGQEEIHDRTRTDGRLTSVRRLRGWWPG